MTGNPQITTEDSNIAEIENAIRANTQLVAEAETKAAVAENEQKNIYAAEEGDKKSSVSASGSSSTVDQNLASVSFDVAMEASGAGGIVQAGQMLTSAIKEYSDPFAYGGAKTFDKVIKDGAAGKSKGNIFTGSFNDKAALNGRAKCITDFMSGEDKVKGVKASETTGAALSAQLKNVKSLGILSTLHAGNALQNKGKVLAKTGPSMGPAGNNAAKLLHEKHFKPSDSLGKDIVTGEVSGTTDWA